MNDKHEAVVSNIDKRILDNIKANPDSIREYDMIPELCMFAVLIKGTALRCIPKDLHSKELCLVAVSQDGAALKYMSKKIVDAEICLQAVRSNGLSLEYVPKVKLSTNIYTEALKQNGMALRYIAEKSRTEKRCKTAVSIDGLALYYVPKSIISKEVIQNAVDQNGLALEYVPGNRKTKKLCAQSVVKNPLALEFVPNRYKGVDLCEKALDSTWRVFPFLSSNMYNLEASKATLDRIIGYIEEAQKISWSDERVINSVAQSLPEEIAIDAEIIFRLRKINVRRIKFNEYGVNSKKFTVIENYSFDKEQEVINEFVNFEEYYQFLDGDLKNARLLDYDFDGIDISKYDFTDAYIRTDILVKNGLYDDTFYSKNLSGHNEYSEILLSEQDDIKKPEMIIHEADIIGSYRSINDIKFFYISDIHLNHKLNELFPKYATVLEITSYIHKVVDDLIKSAPDKSSTDVLLITGDVSYDSEISDLFYRELKKRWGHGEIIVTLGNHELWDYNFSSSDLENIVQEYRELFEEIGIIFLQNDLFLMDRYYSSEIIKENELNQLSNDTFKVMCTDFSFAIFGGLGFSGLNIEYNASLGLYRNTIPTLERDIKETKRFSNIYDKIQQAIPMNTVIVMTHTPKPNWSEKPYNSNWIYVSGHTHSNKYCNNDNKCIYSDNQIGYYNKTMTLKEFRLNPAHDVFKYYLDGIYDISKGQYIDFNKCMGIQMDYTKNHGTIKMLKREGFYCFLFLNMGKLYLLNGGSLKRLDITNVDYYYDNMIRYSERIKEITYKYNQVQKRLSEEIIKVGGEGTIHGCIVDIDYYNHIYLNPVDGSITSYYAISIFEKYVYPNVDALLMEQRPDLHERIITIRKGGSKYSLSVKAATANEISLKQYVSDTNMYGPSRTMKSLQYLTNSNVIRIWKEELLSGNVNQIMNNK